MITTAVAPAVVATAAVASTVADAAAGGQCPPPRSCSRVCCCSRSCPLLQLPRHPSPPRLQRPGKIQAPEEARSRIGMVGSVQCRKNVKQERYTQAVRHSAQEPECLIFLSDQDSSVARRLPARPEGPTSPRTAHRTGTAVRGSRGPLPLASPCTAHRTGTASAGQARAPNPEGAIAAPRSEPHARAMYTMQRARGGLWRLTRRPMPVRDSSGLLPHREAAVSRPWLRRYPTVK